jgi:predicted nucleic acid-binding protein
MTLAEIPAGARVLIDANILIHGLQGWSAQCRALVGRCEAAEVEGWITTSVTAEFSHRRMIQEAQSLGLVGSNPARAMGEKPTFVRQLKRYQAEVRDLLAGGLQVGCVLPDDFHVALEFQRQFGLLTSDSLNLAVARRLGLTALATADRGFDAVQGFIVYQPADLTRP